MRGLAAYLVDGGEGDGADVEGVARVVVDLDGIGGRLLTRCQHLPSLLCDLLPRVQLQQPA